MKRIISLFLTTILLLCCCFSLFGCEEKNNQESNNESNHEEKPKYERIQLNKANFTKYIAINAYITDYNVTPLYESPIGTMYYAASATVHITTSKRADCYFENVRISYPANIGNDLWYNSADVVSPVAYLDYEGNSHCSLNIACEEHSLSIASSTSRFTSTSHYIVLDNISGYVLVPIE